MKYDIDKELEPFTKVKIPLQPKLLPLMNKVAGKMPCHSDEQIEVRRVKVPGYEGVELPTLIVEPKNSERLLPCMIVFHGGGFMLRASAPHYQLLKEYAAAVPCRVIYTDYRLAPEYPFPIPAEDCYAVYQWVLNHTKGLKIDPERIVVSGDSAGGNLAAAVTLMARDRGIAMPAGDILIYPVADRRMITDSMRKFTDTPMWDARLSKMMWECYLGEEFLNISTVFFSEKGKGGIEYASLVEEENFAGFPPTYMEVAEFDCLHDEGVALLERIKQTGVSVELHEIKNACHGYETAVNSLITRACMKSRLEWLDRLLKNIK